MEVLGIFLSILFFLFGSFSVIRRFFKPKVNVVIYKHRLGGVDLFEISSLGMSLKEKGEEVGWGIVVEITNFEEVPFLVEELSFCVKGKEVLRKQLYLPEALKPKSNRTVYLHNLSLSKNEVRLISKVFFIENNKKHKCSFENRF